MNLVKYNDKEYKIINCRDENKRSRYWEFELYPDSCNPDWMSYIKSSGVKCAVSPLHEYDQYEDGNNKGELKKPHWHLLFNFNYGARLSDIAQICDTVNGITHVLIVRDVAVRYDYLTHKNDTDKYRYDEKDIQHINSTRYDFLNSEYREILNFIDDNKVFGFRKLTHELRIQEQDKLLEYVARNPYYVKTYIDDRNDDTIRRMESLLKNIMDIWYNISEDKEHYEEINAIVNEAESLIKK